ncbi:MAG: hypothetical protein FWG77_04875 [Treponema sp.]|nr:hypothetical protein [Treponema sp.]
MIIKCFVIVFSFFITPNEKDISEVAPDSSKTVSAIRYYIVIADIWGIIKLWVMVKDPADWNLREIEAGSYTAAPPVA